MYSVDGLVSNLEADDQLVVVGDDIALPDDPRVSLRPPPRRARVRFVQETVTADALRNQFDSMWFPNYFTPVARLPRRTVTTIHDLQYRHLPENFSGAKRAWLNLAHRHSLRRATVVVAISNFVRDDVLNTYGSRWASKVQVVPNAVSWHRLGDESPRDGGRPYVLSVASHYVHKNLRTLVDAFAQVHADNPDLELVLVGQLGTNLVGVQRADDLRQKVFERGLGDSVRVTGYLPAHQVGSLYRGAALFVFPSVFEGFGLPPVEALGFGLPVITTKCGSLPEVTRGLAHCVDDPFDPEELADAMLTHLSHASGPSAAQVDSIRAFYAPDRIGREMYTVLTGQE
jgi:glycosyltransferase involved in cell wall biosynthesis